MPLTLRDAEYAALVSRQELTLAVRSSHLELEGLTDVKDFTVKPVTNQGKISLVLQVSTNVQKPTLGDEVEEKSVNLIVKRLPLRQKLRQKNIDNRLLEREGFFFRDVVPLLRSRYPQLPVPNYYFSTPNVIYLQDVSLLGYHNILQADLNYWHCKLVFEKLAKFHAATLNINWFSIVPHISSDCVFESTDKSMYRSLCTGCNNYKNIISDFYPDNNDKYLKLLSNENDYFFNLLFRFIKPSSYCLNVLTRGDCWTNNILFKLNSVTNMPEDLYFIDFPTVSFVPPARDLQYFLYNCTNSKFRRLHELDLLKYYVEVFNESCQTYYGDSMSKTLVFDEFYNEYNTTRLYGICMAMMFRTCDLLSSNEGQTMTEEKNNQNAKTLDNITSLCKLDQVLSDEIFQIAEEFMKIVDAFNFDQF